MEGDHTNGYIQRTKSGSYEGRVTIDGVTLPAIIAVFFKDGTDNYLWLKRKRVLDYDFESQTYKEREAKPQWEAYLKKQSENNTVAYSGEFFFLHFKYSIVGVWDKILGTEKQRLNLFVERLPMPKQTLINSINEQKLKIQNDRRTT